MARMITKTGVAGDRGLKDKLDLAREIAYDGDSDAEVDVFAAEELPVIRTPDTGNSGLMMLGLAGAGLFFFLR